VQYGLDCVENTVKNTVKLQSTNCINVWTTGWNRQTDGQMQLHVLLDVASKNNVPAVTSIAKQKHDR